MSLKVKQVAEIIGALANVHSQDDVKQAVEALKLTEGFNPADLHDQKAIAHVMTRAMVTAMVQAGFDPRAIVKGLEDGFVGAHHAATKAAEQAGATQAPAQA